MTTIDTTPTGTGRRAQRRVTPEYSGYDGMTTDDAGNATPVPKALPDTDPDPAEARLQELLGKVRTGPTTLDRPRPTWTIRGHLPGHAWGVAYGRPGGGKSFHTLTLAMELARGGTWAGVQLDPIPVLYVVAERMPVHTERVEAWQAYHGLPVPELFSDMEWNPQLGSPTDVAYLCSVVQSVGAKFVCIDTLHQCMLGMEENSSAEMSRVIDALNQITRATDGGTVHVVHHTGKDPTKGMRGSSAILGAAGYTLEITGDPTAVKVQHTKLNAGAEPMPEWYRLETLALPDHPDTGDPRTGAVMVPTTRKLAQEGAGGAHLAEILTAAAGPFADHGLTRADTEQLLQVSRSTAGAALGEGKARGWLRVTGSAAGTRYWLTELGAEQLPD